MLPDYDFDKFSWKGDIVQLKRFGKEGSNLFECESGDATTDFCDQELVFLVL